MGGRLFRAATEEIVCHMSENANPPSGRHATWSTHTAFILAGIGSAVGLGNVWRFPYITGVNGGGAFIIIYLVCVFLFAAPLLMAELTIGRLGGGSPVWSMRRLTREGGFSPFWRSIGALSIIIPVIGLSYYSIVAGWGIAYMFKSFAGAFEGVTGEQSAELFADLTASPAVIMFWHAVFIAITTWIVARGLHRGLERAVKFMMPALFVAIVVLVGYAAFAADFMSGLKYMFNPDFSKVTSQTVLMAMGQAFFSVAIGVGAMITYGAYLPASQSIPRAAVVIAGSDALVAILAGLAIFPILFSAGLAADQGPQLLFVTMPLAFGSMPVGAIFGGVFFLLIALAGLTSGIGMLEPVVSWLEEVPGFRRPVVALICGVLIWIAGLGAALSFNLLSNYYPLGFIEVFREKTIFDISDYILANYLIILSGLLISLFAGWRVARPAAEAQLGLSGKSFKVWRLLVRYVAPVVLIAIFVSNLI